MKRKVLIALISVALIGCMSIPVFAADPCKKVTTSFKGLIWKYEFIDCKYTSNSEVMTYKIFTKDKNGKKLAEASDLRRDIIHPFTDRTASSSAAKKGYYGYNIQIVGTSHSVYFDKNY